MDKTIRYKIKDLIGNWHYEETKAPIRDLNLFPKFVKNIAVNPSTFCEFTGFCDFNACEVYESDLLLIPHNDFMLSSAHQVFFYKGKFVTASTFFNNPETANKYDLEYILYSIGAIVVNNIHNVDGSLNLLAISSLLRYKKNIL